jgi:hypothetical protein
MTRRDLGLATAIGLAGVGAAVAQEDTYDFMPPGGRGLLTGQLVAENGKTLSEIAGRDRDRTAWADWARRQAPELDPAAAETFAGYAALNFPLPEEARKDLAQTGDPALLPPDGKDLAIQQCQFCHSLFTGYLMHDRDETGWKGTFKSPFHSEIPMNEVERDTFANYSALNMPLEIEDVPPELRF